MSQQTHDPVTVTVIGNIIVLKQFLPDGTKVGEIAIDTIFARALFARGVLMIDTMELLSNPERAKQSRIEYEDRIFAREVAAWNRGAPPGSPGYDDCEDLRPPRREDDHA